MAIIGIYAPHEVGAFTNIVDVAGTFPLIGIPVVFSYPPAMSSSAQVAAHTSYSSFDYKGKTLPAIKFGYGRNPSSSSSRTLTWSLINKDTTLFEVGDTVIFGFRYALPVFATAAAQQGINVGGVEFLNVTALVAGDYIEIVSEKLEDGTFKSKVYVNKDLRVENIVSTALPNVAFWQSYWGTSVVIRNHYVTDFYYAVNKVNDVEKTNLIGPIYVERTNVSAFQSDGQWGDQQASIGILNAVTNQPPGVAASTGITTDEEGVPADVAFAPAVTALEVCAVQTMITSTRPAGSISGLNFQRTVDGVPVLGDVSDVFPYTPAAKTVKVFCDEKTYDDQPLTADYVGRLGLRMKSFPIEIKV